MTRTSNKIKAKKLTQAYISGFLFCGILSFVLVHWFSFSTLRNSAIWLLQGAGYLLICLSINQRMEERRDEPMARMCGSGMHVTTVKTKGFLLAWRGYLEG
jgi:hypothetical protein